MYAEYDKAGVWWGGRVFLSLAELLIVRNASQGYACLPLFSGYGSLLLGGGPLRSR